MDLTGLHFAWTGNANVQGGRALPDMLAIENGDCPKSIFSNLKSLERVVLGRDHVEQTDDPLGTK